MPDSEYKGRVLHGLDPVTPAIGGLAPLSMLRWPPVGAAMRAQDTIPATSRRIVAEWSLSGASGWAQPRGTDDPGNAADPAPTQVYPDNAWRSVGTFSAHVTPGCELRAYVVHCPSGIVQKQVTPVGGDTWAIDSAWAEARVGVTWTNGASSTGPHYKSAAVDGSPTGDYTGGSPIGPAQNWALAGISDIGRLSPPEYVSDPAIAAAYSEWTDAEIEIAIRGGARFVQIVVYEAPLSHVTEHDNDGLTSVHAMPASSAPQTPGPMTRAPDGATYEEHRFGSRRLAQVAERQSERLGPRIIHWTCWDESDSNIWQQAEGNPVQFTLTAYRHLLDSSLSTSSYGVDTPGWIVGSAYAQLARLCDPTCIARGAFAAVPVRVRVDAERAVGNGVVRVQCGPYDWVDVQVTGGRATYEWTGYIEGQAAGDHDAYPLAVYGRVLAGGSTLSVYSVSVDFGTWA